MHLGVLRAGFAFESDIVEIVNNICFVSGSESPAKIRPATLWIAVKNKQTHRQIIYIYVYM